MPSEEGSIRERLERSAAASAEAAADTAGDDSVVAEARAEAGGAATAEIERGEGLCLRKSWETDSGRPASCAMTPDTLDCRCRGQRSLSMSNKPAGGV
jgi:hypothetical protein